MSEQEKTRAERLNELMSGLNEEGQRRLLDYADGYKKGYDRGIREGKPDTLQPRPTA